MTVRGELASLRELHRTLDTSAADIERVARDIDHSLGGTVWIGAITERFRDTWNSLKPTLTPELVDALTEAKEDVKVQHNNLAAATGEGDRI